MILDSKSRQVKADKWGRALSNFLAFYRMAPGPLRAEDSLLQCSNT
jgi:hypothetical protein